MNLADNLKQIRKDNNLSQEQLAERLGVSRQAVSKWESGQSYPEMDKVIQICSLFNLNINELINENIQEVNERKESVNLSNKYINSFFEYITKVVNMFSCMKFRQIILCLIEQLFIVCVLISLLFIIGMIGSNFVGSILYVLPNNIYYFIWNIIKGIYILISTILIIVIVLHIFKVRYLDYYEIIDEKQEDTHEVKEEVLEKNEIKEQLISKKEKIIIRDPKHSEFKFLSTLGKVILFFLKMMTCFVLLFFAFCLICFIFCFAVSFLFVKTGLLFISFVISILGMIMLDVIILELLYNFIVSKKISKSKIFIVSILSLVMVGLGSGMSLIALTDFDYVESSNSLVKDNYEIEMSDDYYLSTMYEFNDVKFVEKDIDNIEIEVWHPFFVLSNLQVSNNYIDIYTVTKDTEIMNIFRMIIKDINSKKITSYSSNSHIYVYASKKNIAKLHENRKKYNDYIASLERQIEKDNDKMEDLELRIKELENIILNNNLQVIYEDGKIVDAYNDWVAAD